MGLQHMMMTLALCGALTAHAKAPTWPALTTPTSTLPLGRNDAAVVVAVERPRHLPRIEGAARNGADWRVWLTRDLGLSPGKVRLLVNADATREKILAAVEAAAAAVDVGGRVWFVFIGHGAPDEDTGDGLLLGADTGPDQRSFVERGVTRDEVLQRLGATRGEAVVVIDACFTGKTPEGEAALPGASIRSANIVVEPMKARARMHLFSPRRRVTGPLPGAPRPAYSYLVLGALRGWADEDHDGAITASEVDGFIGASVTIAVYSRTPGNLYAGDGTAVLARYTGGHPDVPAMMAELHPAPPLVTTTTTTSTPGP